MKNFDFKTIKRILGYMTSGYKKELILVVICIILNTIAVAGGSLYLETLIDEYIVPLIGVQNPDFTSLLHAIYIMIALYAVGIITIFIYNRVMVNISQGVQKKIRDDMFTKMQSLPIKYFDTHTHGDIMSHYTNDTDTLNQMISQSLPQLFASFVTIIIVFIAMLISNIYLTIVAVLSLVLMIYITKKVAGKSSRYFMKQQEAVGKVNGYIEEMINGQKVVKVFCHEEKAKEGFDKINEELFNNTYNANKYANILMPTLIALGNLQYVLLGIIRRNFSYKWFTEELQ